MLFFINAMTHHLKGGAEAIPAFQQSHPVGTILLLHLNGQTHQYPGSVSVSTESFDDVGMVAAEDLWRVRPRFGNIREGGCIEATIIRHEPKVILAEIEGDDDPTLKPEMLHIDPTPGELCFEYTTNELCAQHAGDRLEQLLGQPVLDQDRIANCLTTYLGCCCYSLAADDFYQRRRISLRLMALTDHLSPQLQDLATQLEVQINNFKHDNNIYKVYEAQIADILTHNATLTAHLTAQQPAEIPLMARYGHDRSQHIRHLFYKVPDRSTLYLIYTRLMAHDRKQGEQDKLPKGSDVVILGPAVLPAEARISILAPTNVDLFAAQMQQLLSHLYAHTPAEMEVGGTKRRGVKFATKIILQQEKLNTLACELKFEWKEEVKTYLLSKKHPKTQPFCPALPYLLLGWLRRKTLLFGQLPKNEMARILCQQEGCPASPTSVETYISKANNDLLIYDDYPLMLAIRNWLSTHHPEMWA